ncbi:MAG: DUF6797 domain-containing protein, partial [Verrucomicrobiota bacterium]
MKKLILLLSACALLIQAAGHGADCFPGYDEPGYGRKVAFVGDDPELVEIAKMIAQHYGFHSVIGEDEAAHARVSRAADGFVVSAGDEEFGKSISAAAVADVVKAILELNGIEAEGELNLEAVTEFDGTPHDPYVEAPPAAPYFDVRGGREGYAFADEPVNRFRLYDFYRRQALHFLDDERPAPDLLPSYPSLDGGAFGHWGRFHKNAYRDQRWNWMNNGHVISAIFRSDGAPAKARAVEFRLGDLSAAFDTEALRLTHVWDDNFLHFIPNRWGIGGGSYRAGSEMFALKNKEFGWSTTGEFKEELENEFTGYYQHGERGVLSYTVEGVRILDMPGSRGGVFTRTIEFQDAAEVLFIEFGESAKVLGIDDSRMKGVVREVKPGLVEFHKPLSGAVATIFVGPEGTLIPAGDQEPAPSSLLEGGPRRWDWEFEGDIKRGEPENGFAIDRIPVPLVNPWGSPMLIGGHDFFSNGDAAVCTMMGDVWMVSGLDGETVTWRRFATGLNQALGVSVVEDKVHVIGRDRITRLHDLNDDGEVDLYENVSQSIPASVGGHDFTVGLQADDAGNFYTLAAGEVARVKPNGEAEIIATGFRNANGIGVSKGGVVLASTNEGDWTPASAVMEIQEGDFYGRRAKPGAEIAPAMAYLPRGVDNSSGGQVFIEGNAKWEQLKGAVVHTSFGYGTWGLILRDETEGRTQGALVPMPGDCNSGAHRARFSPKDGQLYISGSDGWGNYAMTDGSFDRVRYVGGNLNLPTSWEAHANGIRVTMTDPIDPESAEVSETFVQQWNYEYSPGYGSMEYSVKHPQTPGHDRVDVASVQVLDERTLFFEIPEIVPVMQMHLVSRLKDAAGEPFTLELFPTLLSLAEPKSFDGKKPVDPDKPTEIALRVRHPKAGTGEKIPEKRGEEGRIVQIDMIAGLRFNVIEVKATPKERLTFVVTNKDPMPHNLVLIEKGSFDKVG